MIIDTPIYIIRNFIYTLQDIYTHMWQPNNKNCKICGWEGKYYKSFYNHRTRLKESTVCPKCGSVDRTRFVFEYLKQKPNRYYNILDIGIGEVNLIKKALPDAHQISIDIVDNGATHNMSITDLKFYDNSFDIIICLAILQEIENEQLALKEMYRTLKIGGEVIIYVPLGYYKEPDGKTPVEYSAQLYKDTRGSSRIYEKLDFSNKLKNMDFKVDYLPFEIHGGYKQDNIIFRCVK